VEDSPLPDAGAGGVPGDALPEQAESQRPSTESSEREALLAAERTRAERAARAAQETRASRKSRKEKQSPKTDKPRNRPTRAFVLPTERYTITSRFGEAGELWSSGHHTGLDFAAPKGTPVRAVHDGTITEVSSGGPLGNHTVLRFTDGTEVTYSHQNSVTVKENRKVRAGDVIGTVGSTGNTTGPHLHLEVHRPDGVAIDPEKWLASKDLKV
jgi:murein DD-endopeptidase MepM/ murein hydrolase activator NlpD